MNSLKSTSPFPSSSNISITLWNIQSDSQLIEKQHFKQTGRQEMWKKQLVKNIQGLFNKMKKGQKTQRKEGVRGCAQRPSCMVRFGFKSFKHFLFSFVICYFDIVFFNILATAHIFFRKRFLPAQGRLINNIFRVSQLIKNNTINLSYLSNSF